MDALEYSLLSKRQEIRDLLRFAMQESPIYLPLVRKAKEELELCNLILSEMALKRVFAKLG